MSIKKFDDIDSRNSITKLSKIKEAKQITLKHLYVYKISYYLWRKNLNKTIPEKCLSGSFRTHLWSVYCGH